LFTNSIRNCAEEQYHQQDDFKFFILQTAQLCFSFSVPYISLFTW